MLVDVQDYIAAKLTHQIHTSERLSRRGCRRRHAWVFRDMFYPKVTAKPLEFGVAYHKAMEVFYDPANRPGGDIDTAYALARVAFKEKCAEQKTAFIRNFSDRYTSEVDEDYKERVELGLGMLDFWYREVVPRWEHNFTPLKVEIPFEVPVGSLWCKCDICFRRWKNSPEGAKEHDAWQEVNFKQAIDDGVPEVVAIRRYADEEFYRSVGWRGLPVTYGGRIDMLAQDGNGDLWVVDWKTTARMTRGGDQGDQDEFLLLDDQITSYCWAMRELGIPVKGFIYVEIKKAYPKEPEPNKVQRLGRWYSVNKQQETTYEIYRRTVEENDPVAYNEGKYDEFLDWLKANMTLEHYVYRHLITRNEAELRNAGRNIYHEACELIDTRMPTFPSPGRFACNFCAFREPCIAMNRDEDYMYTLETLYEKRDRHYWETAESTTDKRYS